MTKLFYILLIYGVAIIFFIMNTNNIINERGILDVEVLMNILGILFLSYIIISDDARGEVSNVEIIPHSLKPNSIKKE